MSQLVEADAPTILDSGRLDVHEGFPSSILGNERNVVVALPPGYDESNDRRYPVLYMHDGQNLFDPKTAFIPGQIWAVDRTVSALLAEDAIEPLIVVGIYNTGIHRMDEYTPSPDLRLRQGGKANLYARMLVEELKPFVDEIYNTRPDREWTGLAGSSLGGLATLHIGLSRPDVFGRLGVLSPSIWWNDNAILKSVSSIPFKPPTRIWLDMGSREGRGHVARARALRDALIVRGWRLGEDLAYLEARNARHSERAWSRRVAPLLRFLYPREHAADYALAAD